MDYNSWLMSLTGGILIGIAASAMLLYTGRIFGVSGILAGVLLPKKNDIGWRLAALGGLMSAGVLLLLFRPEAIMIANESSYWRYIGAGLLVGFGTQLGGGCTSGHGVCGISRLSPRSIIATLVFMSTGMLMVALLRAIGGLS